MVFFREVLQSGKGQFAFGSEDMREWCTQQGDRQEWAGIGVDIGTTTIAAYLWDFRRGELSQQISRENCQTALGTDVMMRMMHSQRGLGQKLHQMLIRQIEEMLEELLALWQRTESFEMPDEKIVMSVVGNPAMCHFFLDKDVSGLAGTPFQSAYSGNYFCNSGDVGFMKRRSIKICVLSGIAAHVGGDALAAYGVLRRQEQGRTRLIADLGTNAEILLQTGGKCYCCSTAAGPALEGKGVICGMRAGAGAVTEVKLAPNTGNIVLTYLSGKTPGGLTGTGILTLMEGLVRCSILTREGYLPDREEAERNGVHPELAKCLVTVEGKRGFLVYRGEKELILYQSDVRNIQLAKGAILAGIQCALGNCGVSAHDVDEVIVAGALGRHLREETAIRLGIFPAMFQGKLSFVGNAAGAGAVKMLLDAGFAADMESKAKDFIHIELAEKEEFKKYLLQGMELKKYNEI